MKQFLIVDDSPVIRKVARRILDGLRFQTAEAQDGREALDACAFLMPDAILMDWKMPNLDGFDCVKELRRMPGGAKPRILICLSESDVAMTARARHCGADDILLKPFDRQILSDKVAELGLVA